MNRTNLANDIWRACDIMRRDDGTTGTLEYMEQLSWLLFLKVFDAIEDRLEVEAELDTPPRAYHRIIGGDYRWSVWAHRDFPADKLVSFIDHELFPYLRGLAGDPERGTIASIFADIPGNRMKSPYNLRDVIAIVDEIDFQNQDDIYTVSHIYEDLLRRMGSESGIAGEFYTPRPIVRFMVERIDPQIGERVYDPACGSAGFLVEAYLHMRKARALTSTDVETLQRHTFYGKEKKPLPCLLGRMNMILHGVSTPNILRTNTLDEDVRKIPADERRDVILTNPPFGGKENGQVQRNFPVQSQATELLFLQHIMRSLKPHGRCAVVVPEGVLFRGDAFADVKRGLLESYDVHTIVSLPGGVFQPYSGVKTNLLFFERSRPTRETWYYEVHPPPGKRFTKGNPIKDTDFDEVRQLWNDRPTTDQSWTVPVAEIVARGYDMTAKNPTRPADVNQLSPEELIASALDKEQQIAALLEEMQTLLAGGD
jgi:type I restriction enzyme M protein